MAGIMRMVENVVAVDSPLGRVVINDADAVAAKIDDLSVVIQCDTLINNGQNQQCGVSPAVGSTLTAVGENSNWTQVTSTSSLNNQPSMAVGATSNGIRVSARPDGVLPSASFFIVIACSFTAAAIATTTGSSQLFSRVGSDNATLKMSVRRNGGNLLFTPNESQAVPFMSIPMSTFTADTPNVLGFHWNDQTHTGRIYFNDIDTPIRSVTNASVSSAIASGDHFDFLYAGDSNRGTFLGNYVRAYVLDSAMMDNDLGRAQAKELFNAVKSLYGAA